MVARLALDGDDIRSVLSLYHLEGLESYGDLATRADHTSYWVEVEGRRYVLRIAARRRFADMVFEKDLIGHLRKSGLPVPRVVENVASGAFTPWEVRGRYVSLFDFLEGRELGVFEIRARHVRAVATFLARLHQACEQFFGHRKNEYAVEPLVRSVERLQSGIARRRLARRFEPDVEILADEIGAQSQRTVRGATGVAHGRLLVDSVKFKRDELVGVADFHMACRERLSWDLAVVINGWCWEPAAGQMGGPAGRFNRTKARAALSAYGVVRPLGRWERDELAADLRLVAARFAIAEMSRWELRRTQDVHGGYRDYRHFMARLVALADGVAERLVAATAK